MSTMTNTSTGRSSVPRASAGALIRATTLSYLGVMVVLPLIVLGLQATEPGALAFWQAMQGGHEGGIHRGLRAVRYRGEVPRGDERGRRDAGPC